jgi:hypothetical protein
MPRLFDFLSEDELCQWICVNLKTLRIEPTHCRIWNSNWGQPKSLAVEASDNGASWTEIDHHEKNSGFNTPEAVKASAVSRSESFGRIHLCQTCPNRRGNSWLALSAFEFFGTVAGLPDDFAKFFFPTVPVFLHMGAVQRRHFVRDG